ncbi:DUF2853 family protein [Frigidibacter oleivorans]|uniref:DUF2853 family protein n=1 Tax=Frigidibacter oleivorans TaxID=2487129 RepID=UPI000F8C42B7|nr:DUF2853 family protein [Frigidibacter oleivorans]
MGKRDELIARYAEALKTRGIEPDMPLLEKVTIGCGPSIYSADSETIAASDKAELARVKAGFLVKKLGLPDGPDLDRALDEVIEAWGRSDRNKYRAAIYYMLVKKLGREAAYA